MPVTTTIIDKKRLLQDAVQAEKDRPLPSVGRETVGIVRAIRDLLPTIHELRAKKVRWAAITDALNAQGIYPEQDGQSATLTTNRLTAIVSTLERRDAETTKRAAMRQVRTGLVSPKGRKGTPAISVALSPEMQLAAKVSGDTATSYESEESLRRRAHASVQHFLKDKP